MQRALVALLSLEDKVVSWPEEAEWKEMSRRKAVYYPPNCVMALFNLWSEVFLIWGELPIKKIKLCLEYAVGT
jgi:hypothetical protein